MPRSAWHTLPAWPRASQKLDRVRVSVRARVRVRDRVDAPRVAARRLSKDRAHAYEQQASKVGRRKRASGGRSARCKAAGGACERCAALQIEGVCLSRASANPGCVCEPGGGVPVVRDVGLEDEDEGEAGAHHGEVEGGDVVDAAIGCDTAQHSGGGGAGW